MSGGVTVTFRRRDRGAFVAALLCVGFAACGGSDNSNNSGGGPSGGSSGPTGPSPSSGSTCSSISVLGNAAGTISARIDGAVFNGGVPTPYAYYTPIAAVPSLGIPAQDFVSIQGLCGDNTSLTFVAKARVGATTFGMNVIDPETKNVHVNSVMLQYRTASGPGGAWATNLVAGTGTITFTSVSRTGAAGSFSLTMAPQAGTGALGNKQVTGQLSVTF